MARFLFLRRTVGEGVGGLRVRSGALFLLCAMLTMAVAECNGEVGDDHGNIKEVDKKDVIGAYRHRFGGDACGITEKYQTHKGKAGGSGTFCAQIFDKGNGPGKSEAKEHDNLKNFCHDDTSHEKFCFYLQYTLDKR